MTDTDGMTGAQPGFFKGAGVTLSQSEGTQQIHISLPVEGCLLKKRLTNGRGGGWSRSPQEPPSYTPERRPRAPVV